jgi:hypothetical protein
MAEGRLEFQTMLRAAFASLVCLALVLGGAPVRAQAPGDDEILQTFLAVALSSTSGSPGDEPKLTRWTVPVRVGLAGIDPGEQTLDVVRTHLDRLRAITGHDIQFVRNGTTNLMVMFAEDPFADVQSEPYRTQISPLFQRDPGMINTIALARGAVPCYSLTLRNAQERPYASLVGVSSRLGAEERRTCIVKQLTRALGLLNTSNATWSVTAAGFRHAELPSGDVRMLQLLYSTKLTQGMTLGEVRKLAPDLLKQLPPGG